MFRTREAHMRTRISLALSFTLGVAALLHADPPDVATLRAEKAAAIAEFLNRKEPLQARLAAVAKMGYPDNETRKALLRLARNTTQPDAIRVAAFHFLSVEDGYLDAALKVLNDPKDGGELLDAKLIDDI